MEAISKVHHVSIRKYAAFLLESLILVCFVWMAYQIPYAHDDWDWGIDLGMEQFLYATVNSRYAGNLLEIVLTRSTMAKTIIMGLTFFLIPTLSVRVAYKSPDATDKIAMTALSVTLFLTISVDVWGETNGWVAGFSNYSFSALMLILWIFQCEETIVNKKANNCLARLVLLFFFTVALQLFLENITVCELAASLVMFFILIHKRNNVPRGAAILVGATVGTFIMFSSDIYVSLFQTGYAVNDYRQLTFNMNSSIPEIIITMVRKVCNDILPSLYLGNPLWGIIMVIALILLVLRVREHISKRRFLLFLVADSVCMAAFLAELFDFSNTLNGLNHRLALAYESTITVFYFGMILFQLNEIINVRDRRIRATIFWIAAPTVLLPMIAVNTIGSRTFYTSSLFIMLSILMVYGELLKVYKNRCKRAIELAFAVLMLVSITKYAIIYSAIGKVMVQRQEIIETAVEDKAEEIILPKFPYRQYLHGAEPVGEEKMIYFKSFYGIPQDTIVVFK